MTDLNFPYNIQPDDDATAEIIMEMFNTIKTLLEGTGLDGANIDSSPAVKIPYSALDLASSIATADLANNAVTPAKLATPTTGQVTNAALVSQATANTYVSICTYTIPTTGTYTFRGTVRSHNATGGVGAGMIQTIVTLVKNGSAYGAADVQKSYESAAANEMIRTQHVQEVMSVVAGDVIGLSIQANFGALASIDVSANQGILAYERRSQ